MPRRIKEEETIWCGDAVTWSIWKMNEERDATLEAAGNHQSSIERLTENPKMK